jgi:hypothetical protein
VCRLEGELGFGCKGFSRLFEAFLEGFDGLKQSDLLSIFLHHGEAFTSA